MMWTSKNGVDIIKRNEGCKLKAYQCPAGIWTIGYGHTRNVLPGDIITKDVADTMLNDDLAKFEHQLNAFGFDLNQNQFDALISFIYNIGIGNFIGSTLKKKLANNPDDSTIRSEFMRWTKSKGKELPELVKRRKEEAELYFKL